MIGGVRGIGIQKGQKKKTTTTLPFGVCILMGETNNKRVKFLKIQF